MNKLMFLIPLVLLLAGISYTGWRTWALLPLSTGGKVAVLVVMALCLAAFFTQFFGKIDAWPMPVATAVYEVGNSSFFILLYVVMLFLLLQLGQAVHLVPPEWLHHSWRGTVGVVVIIGAIFTYGYFHYMHKTRVPLELTTSKPLEKPLRVVMVSDLHLGYHNRADELKRWVSLINAEHPDLVLIAGDIIDRHLRPLREQHMAAIFHEVKAPIVACLGNHEYYSHVGESLEWYRDAGITLLRDSAITIHGINIVGRDDRMNQRRKPLKQLMASLDTSRYTIVLDHQPYNLEQAEQAGADFQLSGHTHYGQVWPISWITDAIYEDAWGPLQKGGTHYYVTSGLGIWGAKFRIGTRSEYLVATIATK